MNTYHFDAGHTFTNRFDLSQHEPRRRLDMRSTLTMPPPSWPRITGKMPCIQEKLSEDRIDTTTPAARLPPGLCHCECTHRYGRYLSGFQNETKRD